MTPAQSYALGVAAYRAPANRGLTCDQCLQKLCPDGLCNFWLAAFRRGWYHAADRSLTADDLARLAARCAAEVAR